MFVFLTGGKTMGHISPLLGIYRRIYKNYKIIYFGLKNSMEEQECKRLNIEFFSLNLLPFFRNNLFKNFQTFFLLRKETKRIKKTFKNTDIKAIISTGGFVSLPLLLAFKNEPKIKKILIEPNIVLGLANRIMKKYVNYICVQFPKFKGKKFVLTGNPIEINIRVFDHYSFYLNEDLLLFLGGSNGALEIIKLAYDFNNHYPNIKIFVITGERYYDTYQFNDNAYVYKKINDISSIFKNFKIIISRAGASTISEIIKTYSCAILLPSKNVSANHQYKNAKYLFDLGAIQMIDNYELDSYLLVHKLLFDQKLISEIKDKIKSISFIDPIQSVIDLL